MNCSNEVLKSAVLKSKVLKRAALKKVPSSTRKDQKGVALIVALLVASVIAAIAIELSWRFELSIARSANRWHGMQANSYLEGAENLAAIVLREDAEQNQVDNLDELWAQPPTPFPTDEGWVKGGLEDAQGRINLNQLANHSPTLNHGDPWRRFTAPQRRFIRLLQTLELDGEPMDHSQAIEITEALIDYLDRDDNVMGFGGAESDYYARLDPPFTIANGPIVSVSELSLVKGMRPDIFKAIEPYVIALPPTAMLNINTAPTNVLRSVNKAELLAPLTITEAQELEEARGLAGFETLQEFESDPTAVSLIGAPRPVQGNNTNNTNNNNTNTNNSGNNSTGNTAPVVTGLDTSGMDIKTSYFLFFGEALVGDHLRRSKSIIKRENGEVYTMRRTDAGF